MKKILALLLAGTMIFSLAACGTEKSTTETSAKTETTSTSSDAAKESDWPNKTITIVVPFNAGGDTDFHARNLAANLEEILGVQVIVTNVAGANGSTGMLQVMNSAADGYTALFFHESMLTNKVVGTSEVAHEELAPVGASIVDNSYVMAVNAKSGIETLDDVMNAAKDKQLLYASSIGGYSYYLGRQLEELAGVDFNIVDAGGGTDRNAALLANKIDINVNPYGVMKPYFDSGDFKAVCTIGDERNPLFPDVPTAKEQGYDWSAERYYFLSFPKGTDEAVIAKMEDAMSQVCQNEEFIKKTEEAYSVSPTFVGSEDLVNHLDAALEEFTENKDLVNN